MGKTVKTYYEYLHHLENEVIKNDGKELSWDQIDRFISKYNLDKDWGITVTDVNKDLKEYLQKWLASILRRKLEWDQRKSCGMGTEQPEVLLSQEDRSISDRIAKAIQKQSGVLLDQKRMAAMVSDLLVKEKLERNILTILLKEGIITSLSSGCSMNCTVMSRYMTILQDQYGIIKEIAERMVSIWIVAFQQ